MGGNNDTLYPLLRKVSSNEMFSAKRTLRKKKLLGVK
jgi:hypothetical protein